MHAPNSSSPRLPTFASSRPVSPFNPLPSSLPSSTTHSRAPSLQPGAMSRRPSFPLLNRDEDSCLIPVEAGAPAADDRRSAKRKLSLSLNGVGPQDSAIKIDWAGTGSTFAPLGEGGREKEESKGGYLQLAMDEISPVSRMRRAFRMCKSGQTDFGLHCSST